MAPSAKENGRSGGRRKSLNVFSRSSLSNLAHITTNVTNDGNVDGERKEKKKLTKRSSMFGLGPSASPDLVPDGSRDPFSSERLGSPKNRPRTLQKGRPTSVFGSLGKRSMTSYVEEDEADNLATSTPESLIDGEQGLEPSMAHNKNVLYHGEVQTQSGMFGMFRKKREYLVLTDAHLIRFKSQSRASETFPSIPPTYGRSTSTRHPSTTSVGSLQEVQSTNSHASAEVENRIPLEQIVTAYRVEDGRPFFTTEVVYLDEDYHGVGSIQLILYDPTDADLWLSSIRGAAQKARLLQEEPFPQRVVRYLARVLEGLNDYDAAHFQVFRVVRRAPVPKSGRVSSSDDLQKLGGTVFYMVMGINCLHLIPVPNFSDPTGRLINPKISRHMYGIVTLYQMYIISGDDRFELSFRMPMQPIKTIELAAFASYDIAAVLQNCWRYVRPLWLDRSFLIYGVDDPPKLGDGVEPSEEEEYGGFDKTLIAHCMAYNCNPANISYTIDWNVEDAPEFRLLPPTMTTKYTASELLAVMRTLRYNESFHSISFRDIDMHSMHGVYDEAGTDHVAYTARYNNNTIVGHPNINPQLRSILYRELQALALKSTTLRRMDFANALPRRRPTDMFDLEGREVEKDPGCEIVAAILPVCRAQMTNISWIVLSGIELGETDLEEMIPALNNRRSRIRAIECSHCGLSDRGILQLLGHLERQNETLECINISDNSGRIDLDRFSTSMGRFSRIRKLDLSRITRTSGDQPLIAPEVLLSWKLEELIMNGIPINDKSLDSIATYLASNKSNSLRVLQMDQCNLNGNHVALLMRSMTEKAGEPRELQLHVSANKLEKGIGEIAKAIQENHTPADLVVRMIEFEKEDHFRQLLEALRTNTTIRNLDISKASLPYDASPETCDTLRLVFAENTTLESLDISGEQAHLEVTRFGIGLNHALTGLKGNKTLKVLRIEYQNLGLEGANTLSTVMEENTGLTHIHCEHNDINLQGFTILVNALARNYSIVEFPFMQDAQDESMKRLNISMQDSQNAATKAKHETHVKSSVRRTLSTLGVSRQQKKQDLTVQDLDQVVKVLAERWDTEMGRMAMFLERNRNIAAGIEVGPDGEGAISEEHMRPTTALSDRGILEQVLNNTTPKADLSNPMDEQVLDSLAGLNIAEGAEDEENKISLKQSEVGEDKSMTIRDEADNERYPQLPVITQERMFSLDASEFFKMD
ncbi:hypothetical protein G7Y89_g14494 [Cudoniella acicularis]|uniref:PH domain-containing protein n=1 Tax=Cudoniella acicularis TaxID=354080 RepID=A0A8H4R3U4_9HELO|nr:hypothetical protein G7Y89_g14494 [Cudoniella acicularis]